ncbi:MAG TPA: aspartate aminotransferase family protein [Jatrophihabitans sp.]|nr:aspartate aminotransferase family protein [Jatrophihabitans sp.]
MTIAQPRPQTQQRAAELEELDRRVLLHPHQTGARGERCVMVRGAGSTVWDASGNELLDAMGGSNWVAQVGHGRAELAQAAGNQLAELEYFTGFDIFSNERAIRLAQRLVGLAPAGLDRVFFTSGGSEGIETAMKLARLYYYHRKQPERTWFIARHFGYHGSTYGSGTLTGFTNMHEGIGQLLPHVEKVSPPSSYRSAEMFGEGDLTDHLIAELSDTIARLGPNNIAAMVGEPVMGGAGVLVPPADYWPRVRELLSQHGILLIADEVVTAFGRTGSWFDSAARGMAADIVVTAKGLTSGYAPLGAVLLGEELAEVVAGENTVFGHGHTYAGHPMACAVAMANLDVVEADDLLAKSRTIGDWFEQDLAPLRELPRVGDIRITGATVGIEVVVDRGTREPLMAGAVSTEMRKQHKIIIREYGNNIVLAPPLVFSRQETSRVADALHDALARLTADGQLH